jgi:thymidylate synthase (FAD)
MDPRFRIEVLNWTENPQTSCWWAMHQDYSEDYVFDEHPPSETKAGQIVVSRLLKGERGHYGPLEHPSVTFNIGWYPHSVMQQARTHRVAVSFDVQSGRYTSKRILDVASGKRPVDEVFYIRPAGNYRDRNGANYVYTEDQRLIDTARCQDAANHYAAQIRAGFAEEHARELIPYAIRQHFVVTFNLRSLMHFLDMRAKRDAQQEIQQLCDQLWPPLQALGPRDRRLVRHHPPPPSPSRPLK